MVQPGTPLFTVKNANPKVPWIANWLETYLMHACYTITVASVAFHMRQTPERYLSLQQVVPKSSIASAKLPL